MARKEKKAAKVPQHEGRLLVDWQGDPIELEVVALPLDDAAVRECGDKLNAGFKAAAENFKAVAELRRAGKDIAAENDRLVHAMATRTLSEEREVHRWADDEAGIVRLYDAKTDKLLAERPITSWERQEEMDLESDDEGGEDS